jgi:hypothetical protein
MDMSTRCVVCACLYIYIRRSVVIFFLWNTHLCENEKNSGGPRLCLGGRSPTRTPFMGVRA